MKVLVVEDEEQTLEYLTDILEKEGFDIIKAMNGNDALKEYEEQKPDFICLDIVLPDISGFDVCKKIRKTNAHTPIIYISAKSRSSDKIMGLDLGADDFITKPFDVHEVIARIRAVARRTILQKAPDTIDESFPLGDVLVFPNKLKAEKGDSLIDLSLRDIKILKLLYDNKNKVVSRDTLLDYCWGAHIMPESRTVDWHISQLRKKIENNHKEPEIIQTVHGVGYKYEERS